MARLIKNNKVILKDINELTHDDSIIIDGNEIKVNKDNVLNNVILFEKIEGDALFLTSKNK